MDRLALWMKSLTLQLQGLNTQFHFFLLEDFPLFKIMTVNQTFLSERLT